MRTPIIATGLLLLVAHFVDASVFQSDSTRKNFSDSARIYFGPNYHNSNVEQIYSSASVTDPKLFHLSAGVNVLNTLRGQSANLLMSNSAFGTTASLRTGTPLYVIDGVPTRNPETFYNLNASEYQHISVINSGNVAARYAGGGMNSVIFLQRKTGANVEGPSLEFTSYTTYASNEVSDFPWRSSEPKVMEQWMFTNSIAYAQDFGAVDTRVSYTYGNYPEVDGAYQGSTLHTASITTGLDLDRFQARLILDQFAKLNEDPSEPLDYFSTDAGNGASKREQFVQGNLALSYHFSDWFNLSSITVLNYLDDDLSRVFGYRDPEADTYELQSRVASNLFLSGATPDSKIARLNYSIGYQTDKTSLHDQTLYFSQNGGVIVKTTTWDGYDVSIKSALAEVGLTVKENFMVNFNYQHNDFGSRTNKTYAVGFMFDFNKAFQTENPTFSTGRFRGNYGKANVMNNTVFPYARQPYYFAANDEIFFSGRNLEGGFDLGFMNNRLNLGITYFHNFADDAFPINDVSAFPPDGPARHLIDLGKVTTNGWEIVAGAVVINDPLFQWDTKLTWGKIEPIVDDGGRFDYFDPSPEWRAGFLNQFHFNNWLFSLLIDTRYQGGLYYDRVVDFAPVPAEEIDLQMQLRDASVGYTLLTNSPSSGLALNKLMLSLSARNMFTIYSSIDGDSEKVSEIYTAQKNISLSITASF